MSNDMMRKIVKAFVEKHSVYGVTASVAISKIGLCDPAATGLHKDLLCIAVGMTEITAGLPSAFMGLPVYYRVQEMPRAQ